MSIDEMEALAEDIRSFLVEKVSKTGGHLASNLGVVEIAIALHREFDSPRDRIIWDVGHQSYVHKILTGRASQFDGLRQFQGISGFPKKSESIHDTFDTGHSSTSISVATGMAAARDLSGSDYNVIAVIGDGAMTGGMPYEALNNLGSMRTKVIIIVNDNGMSISRNVGGLSRYLKKLRPSPRHDSQGVDNVIFDGFGVKYIGPVDGHSLKAMTLAINTAKATDGPCVIHAKTVKGKGYVYAEQTPDKFHGVGAFDPATGKTLKSGKGRSYSRIFGDKLAELALKDMRIAAVCAAMVEGTGLDKFARLFPGRTFDVGIAEEHAVTFAAGLAASGMKPVVAIYSTFLQRAYDQIIEDVCLQNLPVIFAIDRAGIVGADGETHHGLFDLSYLQPLPNMSVLAPRDGKELEEMLEYALTMNGPVAIRYPRGSESLDSGMPESTFCRDGRTGCCEIISKGNDGQIWAVGTMCETAFKAAQILKDKGLDVGITNVRWVKPFDRSGLDSIYTDNIFVLEDNLLPGGFGRTITACAAENGMGLNVHCLGWPGDSFICHGSNELLTRKYGLDPESVAERIYREIEGK